MPKHKKHRCCRKFENEIVYKPIAIPMCEINEVEISLDEFEAMRLCDVDDLDQIQAGEKLGVSRGTVQRLLSSGRKKLLEAIICNSAIIIKNNIIGEKI